MASVLNPYLLHTRVSSDMDTSSIILAHLENAIWPFRLGEVWLSMETDLVRRDDILRIDATALGDQFIQILIDDRMHRIADASAFTASNEMGKIAARALTHILRKSFVEPEEHLVLGEN